MKQAKKKSLTVKLLELFLVGALLVQPINGLLVGSRVNVQAEDEAVFYLYAPQPESTLLRGGGVPKQDVVVEIAGDQLIFKVAEDGTFEIDLSFPLKEGQEIRLIHGNNEIVSVVDSEKPVDDLIYPETPVELKGLDDQNNPASDFDQKLGTTPSSNDSGEEVDLEAADEEELINQTEPDVQEDEPSEGEPAHQLESPMLFSVPEVSNQEPVNYSSAPTESPNATVAQVSNFQGLREAMNNDSVEVIQLTQNIYTESASINMDVRAPNRRKILDGQGNSLVINTVGGFDTSTRIDEMVIRNFSNLYVRHRHNDEGFIRTRTNPYQVHFENVTFNNQKLQDGAHIATGWESTVHFHGKIDIYTPPGREFVTRMRLVKIHDGAQVTIDAGGKAFDQRDESSIRGYPKGLIIGDNAQVNIRANDEVLNTDIRGTGDVYFSVGSDSHVSLTSQESHAINKGQNANFILDVGKDSNSRINSPNGSVIYTRGGSSFQATVDGQLSVTGSQGINFNQSTFNFDIGSSGAVNISTNQQAFYQDINSDDLNFSIIQGGKWTAESHQSELFRLRGNGKFNIDGPETVDFKAPGSVLFSDNPNHTFKISNLKMRAWTNDLDKDDPDVETEVFTTGSFRWTNSGFLDVSTNPPSEVFPGAFPATTEIKRWQLLSGLENLEINTIYDTDENITGTGPEGSQIVLLDSSGQVFATSNTQAQGSFSFNLDEPFVAGTLLRFKAILDGLESDTVEVTVQGNRLELESVTDINFKDTPIMDQDLVVGLKEPVTITVLNTKESEGWHVTARAHGPLTNKSNHQLPNVLHFRSNLIENQAVKVLDYNESTPTQLNNHRYIKEWTGEDGFVLRLNPISAYTTSPYTTTVEWTLTDAP